MQAWGRNEDEPGNCDKDIKEGFEFCKKETELSQVWELQGPLFSDDATIALSATSN